MRTLTSSSPLVSLRRRVLSLLLLIGLPAISSAQAPSSELELLIPAYRYPNASGYAEYWNPLIEQSAGLGLTLILNPFNGPQPSGTGDHVNYTTLINELRARVSEVTLLGYVQTCYISNPDASVRDDPQSYCFNQTDEQALYDEALRDVATWANDYDIDGIFFDEVANASEGVSWYTSLCREAKALHSEIGEVFLNPGTGTAEGYLQSGDCDTVVITENQASFLLPDLQVDSYVESRAYQANRFASLFHTASFSQLSEALREVTAHSIGYVFITSDHSANPWDELPSYWDVELEAIRALNSLPNDPICPDLISDELLDCISASYSPTNVYSYDRSRDTLFARVVIEPGDSLRTLYTGAAIELDLSADPTSFAYSSALQISTEHLWPQSLGAGSGDARADMHHLRPVKQSVNSARSNDPFCESDDFDTDTWYGRQGSMNSPPSVNADEYSERDGDATGPTLGPCFEPPENEKGDVARALFYFRAIYHDEVIAESERQSWFDSQIPTLLAWHRADPVDAWELVLSERIEVYQGSNNPFALDSTLAPRAFSTTNTGVHIVSAPSFIVHLPYPNPAREEVNVRISSTSPEVLKLSVFDVLGRVVIARELIVLGESTLSLPTTALASGIYFIKVMQGSHSETKVFINND